MREDVVNWLRWLLPFMAVVMLLGGIRAQFLPAVPLAIIAVVVWIFLLPRARYEG